ncbi:Gfo/Idh/MocA family oxidoreductase [candidate division NPL-UPA2 bacterium]|nr:Gfo/Idh/MocA family oxidoreductase [candidate division NPL-UPA2 bacterium]
MAKDIGFAVIGCGVIAPWHIRGIQTAKGAKLIAVCDDIEAKARKLADDHHVDWYTDYRKLLKRDDVDVVCLCTPSSLHPDQAIIAAKAGKHIITEKPMAITLKKADAMIKACHDNKVKLAVIFQRRVTEPFKTIKKALDKGSLGKLILGDCYMKYYRSQAYYDSAGWRGTWKYDGGGALMNQGIHIIDLLQWYMGPAAKIYGYAHTLARRIEVEDTSASVLEFKSGAIGVIEGTTSVFPPTIPHRVEIHGQKGTIIIEGEGIKLWKVEGRGGKEIDELKVKQSAATSKAITIPTDIGAEGHCIQIQDMVRAIQNDRPPIVSGEEGRKSIEIILAIYKSSRTGRPVKLPL